ncbi:uncharacterized protein PG986_011672 [Apiospora aurea]|uniref:VWFA domain-containing protein n=1 Tax=Apiospora aurea TaxID=335848 RepID=A0ABR1PXT1_9PEZI
MQQHWHEVIALICAVVPICCERDPNGIDLCFVNHAREATRPSSHPSRRAATAASASPSARPLQSDHVAGILHQVKPRGRARLGARLGDILAKYVGDYSYLTRLHQDRHYKRPMNLIVVTDGHIEDSLYGHLAAAARELDRVHAPAYQAGVQLFQIGHDPRISAGLKVDDDEMHKREGTRDMVATRTWSGRPGVLSAEGVLKVVLGAVSRSLDRSTVTKSGLLAAEVQQQEKK